MKNSNNFIIVTGSEGQVGKNLVKLLSSKKNNFQLILVDSKKKNKKNYFQVNLKNQSELKTFFKILKKNTKIFF